MSEQPDGFCRRNQGDTLPFDAIPSGLRGHGTMRDVIPDAAIRLVRWTAVRYEMEAIYTYSLRRAIYFLGNFYIRFVNLHPMIVTNAGVI